MRKVLPALLLFLCGCAASVPHPGTANAFDSGAYDTLMLADSAIQSTKTDLNNNAYSANTVPTVKSALNGLISAYDIADQIYCGMPVTGTPTSGAAPGSLVCAPGSYHAMAVAGTATPAQSTSLQNAINNVTSASANLSSVKGGT